MNWVMEDGDSCAGQIWLKCALLTGFVAGGESLHPDKHPILTCRPSKGLAENLPFWILLSLKCLLAGSLCRGVVPRAVMGAILYYFAFQTDNGENYVCGKVEGVQGGSQGCDGTGRSSHTQESRNEQATGLGTT